MRIALINPNTDPAITRQMVRIAARHGETAIEGLTAPFGAPLITTPQALDRLCRALHGACLAALADEPSIGAIIIGGGPLAEAAETLAASVPVPVIGPIPAAMRLLLARLATKGNARD